MNSVITFPDGLLGFPDHQRYAILRSRDATAFASLQSIDDAGLAFTVIDPTCFVEKYEDILLDCVPRHVGGDGHTGLLLLAICNTHDDKLTANLLGPLVINPVERIGVQIVLQLGRWSTRHPIGGVKKRKKVPHAK